jgi:hypothetical protein
LGTVSRDVFDDVEWAARVSYSSLAKLMSVHDADARLLVDVSVAMTAVRPTLVDPEFVWFAELTRAFQSVAVILYPAERVVRSLYPMAYPRIVVDSRSP